MLLSIVWFVINYIATEDIAMIIKMDVSTLNLQLCLQLGWSGR